MFLVSRTLSSNFCSGEKVTRWLCLAERKIWNHDFAILNFDQKYKFRKLYLSAQYLSAFLSYCSWKIFQPLLYSLTSLVRSSVNRSRQNQRPHFCLQFLTFFIPAWDYTTFFTAPSCPVFRTYWFIGTVQWYPSELWTRFYPSTILHFRSFFSFGLQTSTKQFSMQREIVYR